MSAATGFEISNSKPLPELSASEKLVVTALWSWLQSHPRPSRDEFENTFRRVKRLAETSR